MTKTCCEYQFLSIEHARSCLTWELARVCDEGDTGEKDSLEKPTFFTKPSLLYKT